MNMQELRMIRISLENTKDNLEDLMEEIIPNSDNMNKLSALRISIEIVEDKLKQIKSEIDKLKQI